MNRDTARHTVSTGIPRRASRKVPWRESQNSSASVLMTQSASNLLAAIRAMRVTQTA